MAESGFGFDCDGDGVVAIEDSIRGYVFRGWDI